MLVVVPFDYVLSFELTLATSHWLGSLTPGLFLGYKVNQILDF